MNPGSQCRALYSQGQQNSTWAWERELHCQYAWDPDPTPQDSAWAWTGLQAPEKKTLPTGKHLGILVLGFHCTAYPESSPGVRIPLLTPGREHPSSRWVAASAGHHRPRCPCQGARLRMWQAWSPARRADKHQSSISISS